MHGGCYIALSLFLIKGQAILGPDCHRARLAHAGHPTMSADAIRVAEQANSAPCCCVWQSGLWLTNLDGLYQNSLSQLIKMTNMQIPLLENLIQ